MCVILINVAIPSTFQLLNFLLMSTGNNTSKIATVGSKAKGDPAHSTVHITSEAWR